MVLNEIQPSTFLSGYIKLYRIIDFKFPASAVIPFKAYPPRPEQYLQFHPKDSEIVRYPGDDRIISNKKAIIIGQHTLVNHRYVGNEFLAFQVVFQPGALYRMTGIESVALNNRYMDAEDILGISTRLINEQLYDANSYTEMVVIIERFLSQIIKKSRKEHHAVDAISKIMLQQDKDYSVDAYMKAACLCHRQFDRKFSERIGISPKQFLRIIRFDKVFRMRNRYPLKDWLTVALHCGYYDYQHLVKDYKEFTGHTPNQFSEIENKAPERSFGDVEV